MADERVQVLINPPTKDRIQFVYKCLSCSPTGEVIYVFNDQTERTMQAALHRTLNHRVLEYQRKNPLPEEAAYD